MKQTRKILNMISFTALILVPVIFVISMISSGTIVLKTEVNNTTNMINNRIGL